MARRRFGSVRRLPSGHHQARFVDPTGRRQTVPQTFRTEADGQRYLDRIASDIKRGL